MSAVCVTISWSPGGLYRRHVNPVESEGNGLCLSTIQDDPSSDSQAQTVPRNHHDTDSSVLHGLIMDAGTTSTVMRQSHLRSRRTQISHSTSSSTWRRSRQPDIPMLKSTCVETLKSFIQKAGIYRACCRVHDIDIKTIFHQFIWDTLATFCVILSIEEHKHFQSSQSALLQLSGIVVWWQYCSLYVISHQAVIMSVLRHWKYDPAEDPNVKMLLRGIWLARLVQCKSMPQWSLHLVLLALLQPLFASAGDHPTDRILDLKWRTLKTCFLLPLTTACRRLFLHALSVAPAHIMFGCGDVDGQSTNSLLCTRLFLHIH